MGAVVKRSVFHYFPQSDMYNYLMSCKRCFIMKRLCFSAQLIFCCTLTIFLAILIYSGPSLARSQQDEYNKAVELFNDGMQQYDINELSEAVKQWEEALTIFKSLGQKNAAGTVSSKLGQAYCRLGDYRKAIGFYEQTLAVMEELADQKGKGVALGNLGSAYLQLGDSLKASGFYDQALTIAIDFRPSKGNENRFANLIITKKNRKNDYRKTTDFYQKALINANNTGDKKIKGATLGNLGSAYLQLGDSLKAIGFYEQALTIAKDIEADKKEKK